MTPDNPDDSEIDEELKKIPRLAAEVAAGASFLEPDDAGNQEAQLLTRGWTAAQIEKRALVNESHRNEKFRDHFERIAITSLWIAAFIMLSVVFTWFWHLLTPESWHWMKPDAVAKLQSFVTGGIIATIGLGHLKKRLGP